MVSVWHARGAVLIASACGLPVAALVVWLLTKAGRPVRYAVAEVGAIAGTLPWVWMILTPSPGTPRRVSLVPFADLGGSDQIVQIGGNLLVFAALGFFLPIRVLVGPWTVLLIAAAASSTVEVLQYVLDLGRVSSVDDVLLNATGAALASPLSRHWWRQGIGSGRSANAT
jgi:hypothetical protein